MRTKKFAAGVQMKKIRGRRELLCQYPLLITNLQYPAVTLFFFALTLLCPLFFFALTLLCPYFSAQGSMKIGLCTSSRWSLGT